MVFVGNSGNFKSQETVLPVAKVVTYEHEHTCQRSQYFMHINSKLNVLATQK